MTASTDQAFSDDDRRYMAQALTLAERGLYTTAPNPRVGCVIVNNGDVVGTGWHRRAGNPHAEINALVDAGSQAAGATVYVTLEPCNHQGRTAPCVDALIRAGVAKVIFSATDPNPQVRGAGSSPLQEAGIDVASGLLIDETVSINRGFFKRMQQGLPHVAVKLAMSLDGRTAMASGESQWITGAPARAYVQQLRACSCAIVTGMGTVLYDNPGLDVRESQLGERVERQPTLVVIDRNLETPFDAKIFNRGEAAARPIIFICSESVSKDKQEKLSALGSEVLTFSLNADRHFQWNDIFLALAEREINEVLVESGAGLAGSLLDQHAVDELHLFVAPKIFGSSARPLFDLSLEKMSDSYGMRIASTQMVGDDWYVNCVGFDD